MYQPDGTSARLPGTVTVIPPGVRRSPSATERWSVSVTWVTALGRISFADVIARPGAVVKPPVPPRRRLLRAARQHRV